MKKHPVLSKVAAHLSKSHYQIEWIASDILFISADENGPVLMQALIVKDHPKSPVISVAVDCADVVSAVHIVTELSEVCKPKFGEPFFKDMTGKFSYGDEAYMRNHLSSDREFLMRVVPNNREPV